MTRVMGGFWHALLVLLLMGVVLSPLCAAAATSPTLVAYNATATMVLGRHDAVRTGSAEVGRRGIYEYDGAGLAYDDASNLHVDAGAGALHANDGAIELVDRRELRNARAIHAAAPATTAAEGAGGGVTTLYRTVAEGERAALEAGGSYETAAGGVEGKYFYPTAGQAQALARANFSSQGVQTLTSVQVPNSVLQGATQLSVAGEGRVIFFTSEQLSGLARPSIWNFFPIGGGAGP